MNYFLYAMAGGERINSDNLESCAAVCGEWKQKCCATVKMTDRRKNTSFMFHCINNAVATSNVNMSIDNYDFSLNCDNTWAGAFRIGMGMGGLVMISLFN